VLRGSDLRPAITDRTLFRQENSHDPLRHAVELLWTGAPERAQRILRQEPDSLRVRALIAECHRFRGDHESAVSSLRELVTESIGTRAEAVMRQHWGKALLDAGQVREAIDQFHIAVELRRDAEPSLLASAQQALQFARERRRGLPPDSSPS